MPTSARDEGQNGKAPRTKGFEEEVGLGRANADRDEQGREMTKEDPVEVRPGQKKGAVPSKRRSTPQKPSR